MPRYYIVAGCNGSGKTTLYNAVPIPKNIPFVNVDKIAFKELHISNRLNEQSRFSEFAKAGKIALNRIDHNIDNEISFCQETTLNGYRIKKNIVKAKEKGFEIILYYVGVDTVEIALERVKIRSSMGGHYINENQIRRRFNNEKENIESVFSYIDAAFFYDNTNQLELFSVFKRDNYWSQLSCIPKWFDALDLKG